MRSPFVAASETDIRAVVERGWGLDVQDMREVLEGAGAHHWAASAADGSRWFVTCDDLSTKPWLGADNAGVFEHLGAAYRTAHRLRLDGVTSIIAPIPARSGDAAVRLDDRHSIAVCERIDGTPGRWGEHLAPDELRDLVASLATLHCRTIPTPALAHRHLDVPGRAAFEIALTTIDQPRDAGPLSEVARRTLREHLDLVDTWLTRLGRADERARNLPERVVITHGETHPGNIIRTPAGLRLIDWDTIALSPPERDLWMLAGADPDTVAHYSDLTGTTIDQDLLDAYRLLWAASDLVAYTRQLHEPHVGDLDDERALQAIRALLGGTEPRPMG